MVVLLVCAFACNIICPLFYNNSGEMSICILRTRISPESRCFSSVCPQGKNRGKRNKKSISRWKNDFNRLAAINKLPNVFSYNYFSKLSNPEIVARFFTPKPVSLHEWQVVFEKFCIFSVILYSLYMNGIFYYYYLLQPKTIPKLEIKPLTKSYSYFSSYLPTT